ncbi:MAG TPA: tyrosine-type recombinase/integrase [Trebonia sp.]
MPGPLEQFADGFREWLLGRGYTPLTTVPQRQVMAHLSRWLESEGLPLSGLNAAQAGRFLDALRASGRQQPTTMAGLRPLLDYLDSLGVLPPPSPEPEPDAASALVSAFARYLRAERGLAPATVTSYSWRAARFIARFAPDGDVSRLAARDVTRMVLEERNARSVGAAQHYACALRALTRYCYLQGLTDRDLAAAALPATGRHRWALPRGITPEQSAALLAACDSDDPAMQRDRAMILLLLRLGLRAGEAAGLRLDDIDWRAGQVTVRGKGGITDRLPLPGDVGEAIAAYLTSARPSTTAREVFITMNAPARGLARGAVSLAVRRASQRAGLDGIGSHRLRHTAACAMVAARVPLPQIGEVLRHRSPVSTAAYARAGLDQLRELARPWPVQAEGSAR